MRYGLMQGYRACKALLQVTVVPEEEGNKCRSPDGVKRNPGSVWPGVPGFHFVSSGLRDSLEGNGPPKLVLTVGAPRRRDMDSCRGIAPARRSYRLPLFRRKKETNAVARLE